MSNEYKEWLKDREEEAMETIHKITDIYLMYYSDTSCSDGQFIKKISDVLEEGGWL